jgi:methylmalonyl-CoA mutase
MKKQLFNEFSAVSASEWKQKIQFDLKGADYNDTLLWKTNEGIEVKPFYNQDDARSSRTTIKKKAFKICETITVSDRVHHANKKAKIALEKGAEVLKFNINSPLDTRELLDGIPVTVHFNFNFLELDYFKRLFAVLREKPHQYFLNIDPIHQLASTGNWFHNITEDFDITAKLLDNKPDNVTLLATTISGYQNAGANSIQQVAYGLSHANEYLNRFGSLASESMQFQLAIGSNYFFEIAKIKAIKLLMASLNKEYNATATPDIIIFCTPTKRNKTLYDYNVNMLRTTTECMSAILGGADTVNNLAYDAISTKSMSLENVFPATNYKF